MNVIRYTGLASLDLTEELKESEEKTIEIVNLDESQPLKVKGDIKLYPGAILNLIVVDLGRFDCELNTRVFLADRTKYTAKIAALTEGKESKKYTADTIHIGRDSESLTSMFGVCSGESHLEFLGTSDIKKGASKTHTRQEGKIVNLSGKAKCEVSPALLIDEEDVYASHAASMGSVSDQDIFYLMSRGLDKKTAERLITLGYLKPIVQEISDVGMRQKALAMLEQEL